MKKHPYFAALFAASALHASWSQPEQISTSNSDQPAVGVDQSGNATILWQSYDGTNYIIQGATIPFNGSQGPIQSLSAPGQDAQNPSIAIDNSGNGIIVWSRYDGWNSVIQSVIKNNQGNFSTPVNVSESGQNADSVKININSYGANTSPIAVWHRYNGLNFVMQASTYSANSGWSTPVSISASGQDALSPVVAVDPNGNGAAVCSRFDGNYFTSRAASFLADQNWSSSVTLSTPGSNAAQQSIDIDANGNSLIAWTYFNNDHFVVQASSLHFGDGWSDPVDISDPNNDSYIPQVVVLPDGSALVAWIAFDGNHFVVTQARYSSGTWSTPVAISESDGDTMNLSMTCNAEGNVIVVWDKALSTTSLIQLSEFNSATNSFGAPITLSNPEKYSTLPVVDLDPYGNGIIAWLESNDNGNYVFWSRYLQDGS